MAFAATSAWANMGIPMLVLAWPALWLALVPVILFEAFLGRKRFGVSWPDALKVSSIGNLWSTFAGVPIVWAALLAVEMAVGLSANALGADPTWNYILFPFMIAWIGPTENPWIVYLAFVLLAIPFCWASIWIERKVARKYLPNVPVEHIHSWMLYANVWSYALIVACTVVYPVYVWPESAT
jgi:hypothetical protein